jgi:hypothetical protein
VSEPPPAPLGSRIISLITAVKGLTIANVVVIALLAVICVPVYIIWKALGDDKIMDRFMSTYEILDHQNVACSVRHVQARGGPDQWAISSGLAYQGGDTWSIAVVLTHDPSTAEVEGYCETLKLIADKMLGYENEP